MFEEIASLFPRSRPFILSEMYPVPLRMANVTFPSYAELWMIRPKYGQQLPFCAVDVKLTHSHNPYDRRFPPSVYGEMFDKLLLLRNHFGVRAPFGFITTYYTWWICWLPDCDAVAAASSMTTFTPSPTVDAERRLHGTILRLPEPFDASELTTEQLQEKRVQVLTFCRQIGSAIMKSMNNGIGAVNNSLSRNMMCYSKHARSWMRFESPIDTIVDVMPEPDTKKFFQLAILGRGVDAQALCMIDANGHRCAVKFHTVTIDNFLGMFDDRPPREILEEEASHWRNINGIESVFVTTLNKQPALVMPYLHPLTDEECMDPAIHKQVIALVESCAERGYIHNDIAWRHVGWYRYQQPHRLMFFDFGRVEKITDKEKAIDEMVRNLCVCYRGVCTTCEYLKAHPVVEKESLH